MKHLSKALLICEKNRAKNEKTLTENRNIAYNIDAEIAKIDNQIKSIMPKIALNAFKDDIDIEIAIDKLKKEHKKLKDERKNLLIKNNLSPSYLDMIYDCLECKDYGYISNDLCSCVLNNIERMENLEKSSVLKISDQTFDRFNFEFYSKVPNIRYQISPYESAYKNFEKCKNYVENFDISKENLLFTGPSGLGKTFLSTAIATEIRKKDYSVIYDTAINFFENYESKKFSNYNEDISRKIQSYIDCDLLIIDDLGTEMITTFTTSTLYNIINLRIISEKPIILSTNLTLPEIAKKYTQAISSRVEGEYKILYFFGDDIRKIKKNL